MGVQYRAPPPQQAYAQPQYAAPAAAPKKKGIALWLFVGGITAIGVCNVAINAIGGSSGSGPAHVLPPPPKTESSLLAKVYVKCIGLIDTVSCSVESNGTGSAKACWDVVFGCTGGEHRAHGCSGLIPAGSIETYTLHEITPPLVAGETCDRTKIQNVEMK